MKKIILSLSILSIVACQKEKPIEYAVLSGQISNSDTKEIRLMSADYKFDKKIELDKDGQFTDTIWDDTDAFLFKEGKNFSDIYLGKGDNILLNYDAKDFKNSLNVSGKGSETTNYLIAKTKLVNKIIGEKRAAYIKLEPADFKAKSKELKDQVIVLATNYEGLSKSFLENETKDLEYKYLYDLSSYESYHSYVTKQPDFKVDEDFLDELNGLDYNIESDYLNSQYYKYLVEMHYRDQSNELAALNDENRNIAFLKVVKTIPNETIKNGLLSDQIESIKYSDDMAAYYKLYTEISTNQEDKKALEDLYEKIKLLAEGQPSPEFIDYENNAGGTMSLSDLKGKYVYIDVWATWCGPCKAEIPFLKDIEKKYHDKNISFLSLSIDKEKDHDKWKKMISEEELGGIQLLADNAWKSKFVQDYQIKGIPHFILLDPEGRIVKHFAPRPSDEKLTALLDNLNL